MRRALPTLVVTAVGLAGLAGAAERSPLLLWLALWAAPAGALATTSGRFALLPPLVFTVALAVAESPPAPLGGALAVAGLYALGYGLERLFQLGAIPAAGALLLAGLLAAGLPGGGGLTESAPWSPRATARLLDFTSTALVTETSGLDWLRHPAVYEVAGADRIGPDLRGPFRPVLAGGLVLVVGCALAFVGIRLRREG